MIHSDVTVKIDIASPIGVLGFGYPLIYEKTETAYPYTECSNLEEVAEAVAGVTTSDTEAVKSEKLATAIKTRTYKAAQLVFMQADAPSKVAVYGSTKTATEALPEVVENGWRHLIVASDDEAQDDSKTDIAAYVEATDKMYFCSTPDHKLTPLTAYKRAMYLYYSDTNVVCPEAAVVGAVAGKPAGSVNYKNVSVVGLDPMIVSTSVLTAIHNAGLYTIIKKSGDVVTTSGKTTGGEYADIIDSKDYIIQQITYQTQKVLNGNDKIPYTNQGIAMLESACVNVMVDAFNNGIIATTDDGNPDYEVSYALKQHTSPSDRKARRYILGAFRFALAGAIDTVDIRGTIEI